MKTLLLPVIVLFVCFSVSLNAQTVVFSEDFELSPVTSIVNDYTGNLPDGPSPCSQASRGTTADFNSTNVDFQNIQNSSYFMGVNPESPCGGFYNAFVVSDTMDFSGYDSLIFKCRYFRSTTLNWGPSIISVVFDNTIDKDTIEAEFVTTDSWDSVEVKLPVEMISPNVVILIDMGGGEGVALDDIEVAGYSTAPVFPQPLNLQFSYTYIMMGDWGYCEGTTVYGPSYCSSFDWNTPDISLTSASLDHYILYYYDYGSGGASVITTTTDTTYEVEMGFIGEMWVTAVYSGPNGESDSSNVVVNNDLPISVNGLEAENQIRMFYRPDSKSIFIKNAECVDSYCIYNSKGSIVQFGKKINGTIGLNEIRSGTYVIKAIDDEGSATTHRFVISR